MAEQKKQEQDTNQLLKVRREKLAELQANGKDPFQITKFNQTHHSLEVKEIYEAHEAELLKDHKEPEVEGLYEEQKNETTRAMAAANLAVYNELFDNYKVAIEWVDKSLSLFEKRVDSNASDITALRDYRRQLMERKSDNSLLQKQM